MNHHDFPSPLQNNINSSYYHDTHTLLLGRAGAPSLSFSLSLAHIHMHALVISAAIWALSLATLRPALGPDFPSNEPTFDPPWFPRHSTSVTAYNSTPRVWSRLRLALHTFSRISYQLLNKRSRTAKRCVSNKALAPPGASAAWPLFKTLSLGIQAISNLNAEPAKFQYTIRFPVPYFSMTKQIRVRICYSAWFLNWGPPSGFLPS